MRIFFASLNDGALLFLHIVNLWHSVLFVVGSTTFRYHNFGWFMSALAFEHFEGK